MTRSVYAQLIRRDSRGTITEALGSFSVLRLDGRERPETWHSDASALLEREQRTGRDFCGYRIQRGSFQNPTVIAEVIVPAHGS